MPDQLPPGAEGKADAPRLKLIKSAVNPADPAPPRLKLKSMPGQEPAANAVAIPQRPTPTAKKGPTKRIKLAAPGPRPKPNDTSDAIVATQAPAQQAIPQHDPAEILASPGQLVNPQFRVVLTTVKPGIRWKEYLIVRPIQMGLTGATYEAYHNETGKRVALKFLDISDDENSRQRFTHFAERLKSLEHTSVCKLLDYVWQPPYVFLITELLTLRGELAPNLEEYCARYIPADGYASERQVLKVSYQLATAMAAAHDLGILHGDLKPANVLFEQAPTDDGSLRLRMRITDFGIAQMLGAEAFAHKLRPILHFAEDADQPAVETAAFLSPEQWKGAPVNKYTDIFSAAAVIHYFLTLNWEARRKKPSTYRPGIHEAWDPVVCMGLRSDAERRYDSAAEFAEYLNVIEAPKE